MDTSPFFVLTGMLRQRPVNPRRQSTQPSQDRCETTEEIRAHCLDPLPHIHIRGAEFQVPRPNRIPIAI